MLVSSTVGALSLFESFDSLMLSTCFITGSFVLMWVSAGLFESAFLAVGVWGFGFKVGGNLVIRAGWIDNNLGATPPVDFATIDGGDDFFRTLSFGCAVTFALVEFWFGKLMTFNPGTGRRFGLIVTVVDFCPNDAGTLNRCNFVTTVCWLFTEFGFIRFNMAGFGMSFGSFPYGNDNLRPIIGALLWVIDCFSVFVWCSGTLILRVFTGMDWLAVWEATGNCLCGWPWFVCGVCWTGCGRFLALSNQRRLVYGKRYEEHLKLTIPSFGVRSFVCWISTVWHLHKIVHRYCSMRLWNVIRKLASILSTQSFDCCTIQWWKSTFCVVPGYREIFEMITRHLINK